MKLLLTSEGIRNKTIEKAFFDLVGKKPEDISLVYVITAPNASSQKDKRWVVDAIAKLDQLKIGSIDIIDPAGLPEEVWRPRLEAADVIYLEGGRAVHLIDVLRELSIGEILKDKICVGASAGSMIFGEKIVSPKHVARDTVDGLGFVNSA